MMRDSAVVKDIVADLLYTYKQAESQKLARVMVQNTAPVVNTENRGDKRAGFFVLKHTLIPAILIEVGFLTNPREEKLLSADSYRQRIAEGIANALWQYVTTQP
jgi:N-acetylmuramoyl-L-alanine amidase